MSPKKKAEALIEDMWTQNISYWSAVNCAKITVAYLKDLSNDIDDQGEAWEYWNDVGKEIKKIYK